MNYKLLIQYDGSRYEGWQRQERTGNTIQGKIEAVLSRFEGSPVEIQGAGRTDAGVHAAGQVANVHLKKQTSCEELREYLNRYLPEDIGILSVEEADRRFHSRLCATGKIYAYRVGTGTCKHVFERKYIYEWGKIPDIAAMQKAAEYLVGEHDFKSFCGNKRMKKSTVRRIYGIRIEEKQGEIVIHYHGDGFLQHMIRILTGTLLEVGEGRRTPESVKEILEAKDREKAGFTAPAKSLILLEVEYE